MVPLPFSLETTLYFSLVVTTLCGKSFNVFGGGSDGEVS